MVDDDHGRLPREQKQAWWTSVLGGQVDQPYPVPGSRLKPRFEGTTLVISGTVPSEQDRQEIQTDLEALVRGAITAFRSDVEVAAETEEEPGLLAQTLVGTFPDEAQARFAASVLQNQGRLQPIVLLVLASGGSGISDPVIAALRALLTDAHWEDVQSALAESHAVLILTVDETQAFQAREILDEETRSLQTAVLPPIPASVANTVARGLVGAPNVLSPSAPDAPTTKATS